MKTLLVLEDEPSVMKLLRLILKGYSVIEATSAEQALNLVVEHDRRVDLLITDVRLPTLSGIQVALRIRSEFPEIPVLLVSGYPAGGWRDVDSADLEQLGATALAILPKPFEQHVLLNTVSELIGSAQPDKARTA